LGALYDYFEVTGKEAWERTYLKPNAMFRQTGNGGDDPYLVAAVLRYALLKGQDNENTYREERLRALLQEIRDSGKVGDLDYLKELPALLASSGLTLVLLDAVPKCRVSGAVQWLAGKPVVLVTLRHKYADVVWFTLFHEIAHVLLHKGHAFIDSDLEDDDVKESEANKWAADWIARDSTV
jgi:HTH-type transcriptional regulator/antitoxin HigA